MDFKTFRVLALCIVAGTVLGQTPAPKSAATKKFTPPKTSWGDPDIQGVWTGDDFYGVPLERPEKYGNNRYLSDEEYTSRAKEVDVLATAVQNGDYPKAGYWARQKGVDAKAVPTNWTEYAKHAPRQSSLIIEPGNGRMPPLTAYGQSVRVAMTAARKPRPESWLDISIYDRCITRGVAGSIIPVIYGNGTQIVQEPGMVAIRYEMIHDTRLVPIDTPGHTHPHDPSAMRSYMGDSRGHWEGNTLVVETTDLIGGKLGVGGNGGGMPYSDQTTLVERFTRIANDTLHYELTVNDPKTWTAPFTLAFEIRDQPGYQIFEYACHEGNYAMRNSLSAARAEEKAEAEKKQ